MNDAFPLPATRTTENKGRGGSRFLMASMYTASYADRAERLRVDRNLAQAIQITDEVNSRQSCRIHVNPALLDISPAPYV